MEVGGGGDLRVSKTDYFFPSMPVVTQMRRIKDDQFVMIITLEMVSRKKVAVLLDFVQMRGGGPCPIFLSPFHKCIFGQ